MSYYWILNIIHVILWYQMNYFWMSLSLWPMVKMTTKLLICPNSWSRDWLGLPIRYTYSSSLHQCCEVVTLSQIAVILLLTVIIYAYFSSLPRCCELPVGELLTVIMLPLFSLPQYCELTEISSLHQCYEIAEILTEIKLTFLLCAGAVRFTDALSGVGALYAASLFKRTLVALQNLIVAVTGGAVIIRIGIPCKNIQSFIMGIPCKNIQTVIIRKGIPCKNISVNMYKTKVNL